MARAAGVRAPAVAAGMGRVVRVVVTSTADAERRRRRLRRRMRRMRQLVAISSAV